MPRAVNPLKPTNPFTGQSVARTGIKTAAQRAKEAAAQARQRQLAMTNQTLAPSGPSLAPAQARAAVFGDPKTVYRVTGQPQADTSNQQFQAAVQQALGSSANMAYNPAAQAAATAGGMTPAPGNPAFPTGSGYQAQTALGKSYRDLMLPSAWEDPEALIDTMYRTAGWDKGSGDYGTQLESADNLGILYMALMGEDAFQGNANFVDWASKYLTDQRRAGGVSLSPGEIWEAITKPTANSPLNYYLNNPTLTPEDQVNNFMSTMRYGMESTLPAPILNALMAQVDQIGREFRSLRNTQSGGASFTEYMGSRPGSLPMIP